MNKIEIYQDGVWIATAGLTEKDLVAFLRVFEALSDTSED